MPSIFISRDLSPESRFLQTLTQKGYTVIGQSLINYSPVLFDTFPTCDWLFFYSKNGVNYFLQQIDNQLLINLKIAAMGSGTAKALVDFGIVPDFIGNGHPPTIARAFLEEAEGQTVVFPQAKNSRRSIQIALGKQIKSVDLVVYENTPKTKFNLPEADILVFTSPLNVQAYFAQKTITPRQRILAIGNTTGAALWQQKLHDYAIAREPSEQALIEGVLQFARKL